jgi:hypothetical protein
MSEIKAVIAVVSNPLGKGSSGECAEGWYTVSDGVLTLTDIHGEPLRDGDTGARFTHRLLPGDLEKSVAKRLTLAQWRANRDDGAEFNKPLRYPRMVY